MNKLAIVLAFLTTFLVGCAAQNTATTAAPAAEAKSVMDDSTLPEIAAYDDEAFDLLTDMTPAM